MKWYKSKTMLFNLLIGMLGVVELNLGLFQMALGDYYGLILMCVAMINVFLRTVTTTSLKDK